MISTIGTAHLHSGKTTTVSARALCDDTWVVALDISCDDVTMRPDGYGFLTSCLVFFRNVAFGHVRSLCDPTHKGAYVWTTRPETGSKALTRETQVLDLVSHQIYVRAQVDPGERYALRLHALRACYRIEGMLASLPTDSAGMVPDVAWSQEA